MLNPILIDSEYVSWNMCPELLEKAIKERIEIGKSPKAIVLVQFIWNAQQKLMKF